MVETGLRSAYQQWCDVVGGDGCAVVHFVSLSASVAFLTTSLPASYWEEQKKEGV